MVPASACEVAELTVTLSLSHAPAVVDDWAEAARRALFFGVSRIMRGPSSRVFGARQQLKMIVSFFDARCLTQSYVLLSMDALVYRLICLSGKSFPQCFGFRMGRGLITGVAFTAYAACRWLAARGGSSSHDRSRANAIQPRRAPQTIPLAVSFRDSIESQAPNIASVKGAHPHTLPLRFS